MAVASSHWQDNCVGRRCPWMWSLAFRKQRAGQGSDRGKDLLVAIRLGRGRRSWAHLGARPASSNRKPIVYAKCAHVAVRAATTTYHICRTASYKTVKDETGRWSKTRASERPSAGQKCAYTRYCASCLTAGRASRGRGLASSSKGVAPHDVSLRELKMSSNSL